MTVAPSPLWQCPVRWPPKNKLRKGSLWINRVVAPPLPRRCTAAPRVVHTVLFGATNSVALRFKRRFESFSNFR